MGEEIVLSFWGLAILERRLVMGILNVRNQGDNVIMASHLKHCVYFAALVCVIQKEEEAGGWFRWPPQTFPLEKSWCSHRGCCLTSDGMGEVLPLPHPPPPPPAAH